MWEAVPWERPSALAVHPPARAECVADPRSHEGYEWFYVLNGRVRLVLGDQDLVLDPGEAAEFDTRTPHWISNPDTDQPAELLMLFGAQGERAHLSVATGAT
jgi:quercetin dioxygenase-like cupin family protein